MSKINTDNWKTFKVGDLFDIHPTKNYNLKNSLLFQEEGNVPVIVNSSFNNGVGGYVNLEPTERRGIITFSDTTSASAIFYQPNDFIGYSHVQGMYPYENIWTEKSMLFFLTVFKKSAYLLGFDYVNKFTRQIAKEIEVKLPVKEDGALNIPYMEKFMDNYFKDNEKIIENINKISTFSKNSINISEWKEFKIGSLFDISRPISRSQLNYEEGEVPFVASGNFNNGVLKYVTAKENEVLDKGNSITISPVDGSCFYQKKDFLGRGGAGSSIIILKNKNLNEYNGLFISTIISKVCSKYSYTNMANKDLIKDEIIKLPSKNENPDWDYMEKYIKSIKIFNNSIIKPLNE